MNETNSKRKDRDMTKEEINIQNTSVGTLVNDVCTIIEHGRKQAYSAVNTAMIETYWKIGKRIVEEE
jgi:TATA-binding protein-associated factor Taf7